MVSTVLRLETIMMGRRLASVEREMSDECASL